MSTLNDQEPPLANDLLRGAEAIREFIGEDDVRRVYYLHETRQIPTFKTGRIINALKSQLRKRFSAPEVA